MFFSRFFCFGSICIYMYKPPQTPQDVCNHRFWPWINSWSCGVALDPPKGRHGPGCAPRGCRGWPKHGENDGGHRWKARRYLLGGMGEVGYSSKISGVFLGVEKWKELEDIGKYITNVSVSQPRVSFYKMVFRLKPEFGWDLRNLDWFETGDVLNLEWCLVDVGIIWYNVLNNWNMPGSLGVFWGYESEGQFAWMQVHDLKVLVHVASPFCCSGIMVPMLLPIAGVVKSCGADEHLLISPDSLQVREANLEYNAGLFPNSMQMKHSYRCWRL